MKKIAHNTLIFMVVVLCVACSDDQNRTSNELLADAIGQYHQKRFDKAIKTAEETLQKAKAEFGSEHLFVAKTLDALALFYNSVNNFSKAESLDQESQTLKKKLKGRQPLSADQLPCPEQSIPIRQTEEGYPDKVPQEIINQIIANYAEKDIHLSALKPLSPLIMDNGGMIFPYQSKTKDQNKPEKNIILLFASIKDPDNKNKALFKNCRIVTYQSYLKDLDKGGIERLKNELAKIFPELY